MKNTGKLRTFHTIAVPHKDVLDGNLTMDVFAADLWEVHMGRAPADYRDSEAFFNRTYLTQGLRDLLSVVEKRIRGTGGDPVIQLQTPFGGGKTHALIALYHKSKEWQAKRVVIVGTALQPGETGEPGETIWGEIEKQLTGSVTKFGGMVSPGKEAFRQLLETNQPLLILIDELLQYVTKAAGKKVEGSTLASQTIAFMQELVEIPGTLEKTCLIVTLPSSIMEHYDENAERAFQQLQKVSGRVEKVYTPVQDEEITKVIKRRLFSSLNEAEIKNNVSTFLTYAENEGILPAGVEFTDYRDQFIDSYPFMPEVVDVLYKRWGSLTTFQRTRGVLRLLALVIHSLKSSYKPYISLADFDLDNSEIRRELVKHIGNEYDSVIASDITSPNSGSKIVDNELGKAYQGLKLGTRASTTIFLYSFSGAQDKGTYLTEIKRLATTLDNPSSAVAEAVDRQRKQLFFLQSQNDKYYFSNKPNLNRILLTKMENVKEQQIIELQHTLIEQQISGKKLKTILYPKESKDIAESEDLKLVIFNQSIKASSLQEKMKEFVENKGESPRVYRNTILFLTALENQRENFDQITRRRIAYEMIIKDAALNLSAEDRKNIAETVRKEDEALKGQVKMLYRLVYVPAKGDTFKAVDLGIPTYGEKKSLDESVYDQLRNEGEISEKISAAVLASKYLSDRKCAKTKQIYDSLLRTPGEERPNSREAVEYGIREGVRQGIFGLGTLINEEIRCLHFPGDTSPNVFFEENEIIIDNAKCKALKTELDTTQQPEKTASERVDQPLRNPEIALSDFSSTSIEIPEIQITINVPRGQVSQIMGLMNFLQQKYQSLNLQIKAADGAMSDEELTDHVKETLKQLGIDPEKSIVVRK
jgi:hypothetical protein